MHNTFVGVSGTHPARLQAWSTYPTEVILLITEMWFQSKSMPNTFSTANAVSSLLQLECHPNFFIPEVPLASRGVYLAETQFK